MIAADVLEPVLTDDLAAELCTRAVTAAKAAGADLADAFLSTRRGEWTRFGVDRVHQPQDVTEWTLTVRAVVDGRAVRVAIASPGAIESGAQRAVRLARALVDAAGPDAGFALAPAPGEVREDLPLWSAATAEWDVDARVRSARGAMAAAARAGGTVHGMLGRALTGLTVVTTEGLVRSATATEAYGSCTVTVDDGTSHWMDVDRDLPVLGVDDALRRTVQEAVAGRGRTVLPAGRYDVVFGPLATGGLLESIAAFGFTGDSVASGVGAVARRRGERIAAAEVDVADDPAASRGLPFPFDIEGTPAMRVPLLDRGVVGEAVTDRVSAAAAGLPATGHAHIAREETPHETVSSVVMAAGSEETAALVAGVEHGVYVQRLWYLRVVDPGATTITGGSRDACHLIEDGRIGRPIAPARFTESVFGALSRTDAVGSEVLAQPVPNVWNGSVTAPAIRVRGFRFGAAGEGEH